MPTAPGAEPLPAEPRLLLVRTSALGDVVHCLPVLTALRRHRPRARIAWAVEEAYVPLLAGHPDLDLVVPVRSRSWRRAPLARATRGEVVDLLAALRDFAPDVALDLMGNHKGGLIARASGAARVVGPARPHRREPSSALWVREGVRPRPPEDAGRRPAAGGPPALRDLAGVPPPEAAAAGAPAALHAVDRALSLLAPLGVPAGPADFAPAKLLAGAVPSPGRPPYVAIHPGAGWANKAWPPERWGEAARRIAGATGLAVRVPAGLGEETLAGAVEEASGGAARAEPAASLPALAALLRGARLVVAGDTGPLHLAHALGVPVLAVLGPTDPRRHGPHGAPDRAVWKRLPCSFCYRRFDEPKACLLAVPAAAVAERAVALLAADAAAAPAAAPAHGSFASARSATEEPAP